MQQVEIDKLDAEQIRHFAGIYLGEEQGAAFWRELQGAHARLLPLAAIPFYLNLLVEEF